MSDGALLTVAEVAEFTRLSIYTVRAAIRTGELPASRLRGRLLVDRVDLADWIEANRVQGEHEQAPPARHIAAPRSPRTPPAGGARQAVRDRRSAA